MKGRNLARAGLALAAAVILPACDEPLNITRTFQTAEEVRLYATAEQTCVLVCRQLATVHACGRHASDGSPCDDHFHTEVRSFTDPRGPLLARRAVAAAMGRLSAQAGAAAQREFAANNVPWNGQSALDGAFEWAQMTALRDAESGAARAVEQAEKSIRALLDPDAVCSNREDARWEGDIVLRIVIRITVTVTGTVSQPLVGVAPVVTITAFLDGRLRDTNSAYGVCKCGPPPPPLGEPTPTPGTPKRPTIVPEPGSDPDRKQSRVHVGDDFKVSHQVLVLDEEPARGGDPKVLTVALPMAGGLAYGIYRIVHDGTSSAADPTRAPAQLQPGQNVLRVPDRLEGNSLVRAITDGPGGRKAIECASLGADKAGSVVVGEVGKGSHISQLEILELRLGADQYAVTKRYEAQTYSWQVEIEPVRTVGTPLDGQLTIQASQAMQDRLFRFSLEARGPFQPNAGTADVKPGTYRIRSLMQIVPTARGSFDVDSSLTPR